MARFLAAVLALLAAAGAEVMVYEEEIPHILKDDFRDLPASFGPDLPFEGLRGVLVEGAPADGCGNMTAPPPLNLTDNYRWIVIVGRFNCTFEEKVRYAMLAGYDCVIVYNNSTELETMSAQHPEGINIPAVFVNKEAGDTLRKKYTYINREFYIMVNGDLPFNINTHLLLPFAVVVALCLIIIIIFMCLLAVTLGPLMIPIVLVGAAVLIYVAVILMIVKCIKDRRRARRHRLPNRSLRKIPTCKFSKGDPYDTCAICLDDYQEGERLRVLPCAHAYHAKCIDPWLTQNRRVCPVCKRKVLAAGERDRPRGSDSDDSDSPLLDPEPTRPPTQGGTFEEQRENPFTRAARLMSRLRRGNRPPPPDVEEAPVSEEAIPTNETEEAGAAVASAAAADTAPLLAGARRTRSRRRARSATHAPAHAPAAPDTHSINTDTGGEIGVAALPALPHSTSTPLDRQPTIEYR